MNSLTLAPSSACVRRYVEPAMRIINEMELEEGTELSLSNLKAALAAYAEKTVRDWNFFPSMVAVK